MKLGLKALSPFFISTSREHAKYFELGYEHFFDTCSDLDIDTGDWEQIAENARTKVDNSEKLDTKEQRIAFAIGYGDVYWFGKCMHWSSHFLKPLGKIADPIARFRMKRKIHKYTDLSLEKPDYSTPNDIDIASNKELSKIRASLILHLEWFDYILDCLDIDHSYDIDKAKEETIDYFTKGDEISEETRNLQIILCSNDMNWINRLQQNFDYETFWLKSSLSGIENVLEEFKDQHPS